MGSNYTVIRMSRPFMGAEGAAAGGGPIARTGTASEVNASAGNGSTSVTVPADCNLVIAFWEMWDNDQNSNMSSLTIGGAGLTIAEQRNETANLNATGVAYKTNPTTGSVTFAWTWSLNEAKAQGGKIVLVYIKNGNTADPFRDTAIDAQTASNDASITLTSVATDLVLGMATSDTGNPGINGSVFLDNATLNLTTYDASEVTAGDPTTVIDMTGENYSSIVGISLKSA